MHLSKSSRYALHAALELAIAESPVTVAEVARRYRFPPTALAKVMQAMVRARIARASRGVGGGYVLAREATAISTLDVISIFDPALMHEVHGGRRRADRAADRINARLLGLLAEVDQLTRCTFASVSLDTLVRGAAPVRRRE